MILIFFISKIVLTSKNFTDLCTYFHGLKGSKFYDPLQSNPTNFGSKIRSQSSGEKHVKRGSKRIIKDRETSDCIENSRSQSNPEIQPSRESFCITVSRDLCGNSIVWMMQPLIGWNIYSK